VLDGSDIVAWSEGYHAYTWLSTHTGDYAHYTAVGCRVDNHKRNVGHDVIISVKHDWTVKAHGQVKVAEQLQVPPHGDLYHPERWAVWVLAEKNDLVVLALFWHPQPGPTTHPKIVLPSYKQSNQIVETQIKALIAEHKPDVVLAGGDLQVGSLAQPWGPNHLFAGLGMTAVHDGIVWTAVKGAKITKRTTIAAAKVGKGMDHPHDVLTLEVA